MEVDKKKVLKIAKELCTLYQVSDDMSSPYPQEWINITPYETDYDFMEFVEDLQKLIEKHL